MIFISKMTEKTKIVLKYQIRSFGKGYQQDGTSSPDIKKKNTPLSPPPLEIIINVI
jgi:hypothetical protein